MKKLLLITALILLTTASFSQRNISVIRVSTDTVKAFSATKTLSLKDTVKIDYADITYMNNDSIETVSITGKNIGTPERCFEIMILDTLQGCGGNTILMNTGITVEDSLIYTNGANDGYVLTSDVNGYATWQAPTTELLTFDVTIPHDSILIMYTRPQELIAAPGANKLIVPISIVGYYYYNGVPYATNTECVFGVGSFFPFSSSFVISGIDNIIYTSPFCQLVNVETINIFNGNFNISIKTGNPTGGTAGNYIRIKGKYYIEDFN